MDGLLVAGSAHRKDSHRSHLPFLTTHRPQRPMTTALYRLHDREARTRAPAVFPLPPDAPPALSERYPTPTKVLPNRAVRANEAALRAGLGDLPAGAQEGCFQL